jgi:hypothetical protein
MIRVLVGLSGLAIAIPLLVGWCKWRLWEWQRERSK